MVIPVIGSAQVKRASLQNLHQRSASGQLAHSAQFAQQNLCKIHAYHGNCKDRGANGVLNRCTSTFSAQTCTGNPRPHIFAALCDKLQPIHPFDTRETAGARQG